MQASVAAHTAGVSIKALRYYESLGLIIPQRLANGYRNYSEFDVQLAREIAALLKLGLSAAASRPFVACLRQGHTYGDECAESISTYTQEIQRLETLMTELGLRRDELQARLNVAAGRGFPLPVEAQLQTPRYGLPVGLPTPQDDGRTVHLPGLRLPGLPLVAHNGKEVDLHNICTGRWILFVYPLTGVPGHDLPEGWDNIPGARGCTAEACSFRDYLRELTMAGAEAVYGLSSQSPDYQAEVAGRLHLPYLLLSDPNRRLGTALKLPTFNVGGQTFYSRLTLILCGDQIEHVFYPIFPPNEHAAQVLNWLQANPL